MPPAVAALPRDKRGFPVPWVSEWNGNTCIGLLSAPHLGVVATPFVGCDCVIGVGEPDLGTLCQHRQIRGMVERLCDVCGEFIPPGPLYFLGGDVGITDAGQLVSIGITETGFRECALHHDCALYSAQVCPALTTKGDAVKIVECLAYCPQPEFQLMVDGVLTSRTFTGFQDPALAALSAQTRMILAAVFAVPVDPVVTPVTQWVEQQLLRRSA